MAVVAIGVIVSVAVAVAVVVVVAVVAVVAVVVGAAVLLFEPNFTSATPTAATTAKVTMVARTMLRVRWRAPGAVGVSSFLTGSGGGVVSAFGRMRGRFGRSVPKPSSRSSTVSLRRSTLPMPGSVTAVLSTAMGFDGGGDGVIPASYCWARASSFFCA